MIQFRSKIAWWFYAVSAVLLGVTALMVYLAATVRQTVLYIAAAVFLLVMGLLIIPMLFNTKYVFAGSQLHISCGLYSLRIPYARIMKVAPNFDPASAPALSLDRVQIQYSTKEGNNNFVSVSPRDKEGFMKELARRR